MDFDDWCEKEGIDTSVWKRVEPCDTMRCPTEKGNTNTTSKSNTSIDGKSMTMGEVDGGGKGEEVPQNETEEQRRQRMIALLGNYHPN
jgi:hypothetical protein